MIPNFTQIQQPCDVPLQEWQFGRTFQAILKEVTVATTVCTQPYVHACVL